MHGTPPTAKIARSLPQRFCTVIKDQKTEFILSEQVPTLQRNTVREVQNHLLGRTRREIEKTEPVFLLAQDAARQEVRGRFEGC